MAALTLDPQKTALVLIDLQNGIVARDTKPYSTTEVVTRCRSMVDAFRAKGARIVFVHVDLAHFLELNVDQPSRDPNSPPPPAEASELVPAAGFQAGDVLIEKIHWGAFAGTGLEDELRQRGIDTVVIGGIATNMGVESTVRQGTGLGFNFVVVEDACATFSAEMQDFSFKMIFPRLALVRSTSDVLAALA